MKKHCAVLIAAILLVTVAGCKGNQPKDEVGVEADLSQEAAYRLYTNAIGEINTIGSFSGNIILKTVMSIMGEPYEYNVTTGVKQIFGNADKIEAEIVADESVNMDSMYYKDGMLFYSGETEKVKFPYPGDAILKMTNSRIVTEVLFPESDIFGYEATEYPSGTEVLFDLYSKNMEDILREITDYSMTGGVEEHDESEVQYSFDDVLASLRFDKTGNLEKVLLSYVAVFYHFGDAYDTYIELGVEISQIGGVSINFPSDLDSYTALEE